MDWHSLPGEYSESRVVVEGSTHFHVFIGSTQLESRKGLQRKRERGMPASMKRARPVSRATANVDTKEMILLPRPGSARSNGESTFLNPWTLCMRLLILNQAAWSHCTRYRDY